MAMKDLESGDIKRQDLDDMTTCCICTEVYTDPKALPCTHTFCMKCLQENGIKTNKGPGDEMPCPICRQLFKIPVGGFHGLPKNIFIEKLIQMANVSGHSSSSKAQCDACLEENKEAGREIRTADTFCADCKQKYCEECSRHHRKFKLTKDHRLIKINEHDGEQNWMTYQAQCVCELHQQKVVDVYCADCKTVVCAICFIDDHKHHDGSHVDKFVDGFRRQIECNVQAVNECRSIAQMKQAEFLNVKEDIQERVIQLECDVANRKDELKQLIDKHATSLLQGLSSTKQSKLKEIQMATDEIETYLSSLETYNTYCQKIMAGGSASDICRAFSTLSVRAMELQQQCKPVHEREVQSFNFCLRKSELKESCNNLIGKIEEDVDSKPKIRSQPSLSAEQTELRYKSDPVLVQTIRTNSVRSKKLWLFRTAEESKDIRGLTILDKELFVVSQMSSEVEVYDSMKFSFSRRWNLNELIYPLDIESCHVNKCLYIFDFKGQSNEILRVDPNGNLVKNWSTGTDWGYGLSLTDESNVILAVCYKNKLNEYSPDGQLIREINLSSNAGIRHPGHAIKLTNGNFVVSHGFSNFDLHRVCIVDAGGNLKKSFDEKRGSNIGQINIPFCLSVDGNGFLMVADHDNGRVLLLNSDLEFKREILSKDGKHGLKYPQSILLDESNGRLFVADNDSNNRRILIFNI